MKATGIVRRIDDLGRVVIPKEIRRTMRIREGDPLEIFTDREGELIFKKYSPVGELSDFAAQICESMRKSTDGIAAVCDRDAVIAIAGGAKRELLGKPISGALSSIMEKRAAFRHDSGGSSLPVSSADEQYCLSVAAPVLTEGDVMGCVMFVTPRGSRPAGELELKLAQTVACFLGKQMES
jgi:AbrB family transcriptional regulator (stage V sporulation protein T)